MRPLKRPRCSSEYFAISVDSLLMQAFGPYCAICERRLPDEAWIWHKKREESLVEMSGTFHESPRPVFSDLSEWPYLLILCRNCINGATASAKKSASELIYPDEDVTFSLDEKSPFRYVMKTVTIRNLSRSGVLESVRDEKRLIVEGNDARARSTIQYFRLNGASYDESNDSIELTFRERMTQADERVTQRTNVYDYASEAADRTLSLDEMRGIAANLMRQVAGVSGFWSVWATVLNERSHDADFVREAMAPQDSVPLSFIELWPWRGATPDWPFPGTRIGVI
jgi:hypothetical protein